MQAQNSTHHHVTSNQCALLDVVVTKLQIMERIPANEMQHRNTYNAHTINDDHARHKDSMVVDLKLRSAHDGNHVPTCNTQLPYIPVEHGCHGGDPHAFAHIGIQQFAGV